MFSDEIILLARETLDMARSHGLHLMTAESCTGGLVMAALTEISGASDVIDRGFITYSNQAKTEILKVDPHLIEQYGAVSEQCARAMATGALKTTNMATVALSVTGIAGPGGGSPDKPVGLVHLAVARRDGIICHRKHLFGEIDRNRIRQATVIVALKLFQEIIGQSL